MNSRSRLLFSIIILAGLGLGIRRLLPKPAGEMAGAPAINELLAANRAGISDEDGDHSDWIEVYNPGRQRISLAGWALTDDPDQPEKWTFPDITLGGQAYLLVFASGKNRKPAQPGSELHTNFKLSQQGEFLGLYSLHQGRFAATFTSSGGNKFPKQLEDVSYGRYRDREQGLPEQPSFVYLLKPTPGQPNDAASFWAGLVSPVSFSLERGFYETPFILALSTATPGATIRYTTDGREPAETQGEVYRGPIEITATTFLRAVASKPNFKSSPAGTHTYLFLDDVLGQPPEPSGFPKRWGGYQGVPVMADYEMDPEIVNDPPFGDRSGNRSGGLIKEALKSIPTLSIVTGRQSFHDLYANPRRKGRAWERPASVELFDPHNNQEGFQINAGLRIQGELGRLESMPKHAFRLFFREAYGAARLKFPLFPDSPIEEFDTLILRGGVNRSYAGKPDSDQSRTTYTRDEWLRASQIAMSGSGSHGTFVHLYLNGLYWGLYNLVERPDAAFMSAYFGGSKGDWQTTNHAETIGNAGERFGTLHKLAAAGHLEDPKKYAAIKAYLDIPHFIDYLILNWYAGNLDWAFNNWYAGARNPTGRVRYFVWDGERTWYEGAEIFMELDDYEGQPNLIKPLFEALLANPDFRLALADRMAKHLFNDGALSDANSQARWIGINKTIEGAILAESARWGDTREDPPITPEVWFEAQDDVLAQMKGNAARLISLAREAGYYPDIDPPQFSRSPGRVGPGFSLAMTLGKAGGGIIYFTADGSDPRQPVTGLVSPAAKRYAGPLVLTATSHIKARTFNENTWSALNEAVFEVGDETSTRLQVTEVMYNPLGSDDYEFFELKNGGHVDLDLANISFEGITFTFPAQADPLAPGEVVVLVRNPARFAERYPGVAIGGVYKGHLSNRGEKITLRNAEGKALVEVNYDDGNGWPVSPDGRGDSLVLIDPDGDPSDPGNWRASRYLNGSPGADDVQR